MEKIRWAPPESAVRTERRNGKAEFIVLVAAGTTEVTAPDERAKPGSLGMLNEADGRARLLLAAVASGGDWGSAICPNTLKMVEIGGARMQKNDGRTARFCPHVGS